MDVFPRQWRQAFEREIWDAQLDALPPWKARIVWPARLVFVLVRDLLSGELTLRAMSLVYTTLLSLVPLLALSFSVLKSFGVYNQIGPMLRNFLAPLGPQSEELTRRIIEFIDRMNVGVLGSVGLALLVYTSISLMQKIEESFNFIWHVTQPRGLSDRFSRYLSVLLVGPLLVFAALGITATILNTRVVRSLASLELLGEIMFAIGNLVPYLLVIGTFTFLYVFIPNTKVRLRPAFVGGAVGGILWQSAGWAFALFVATSTSYAAIYSSFAILVLFLIWLYLSWLILLFGASAAFYLQNPAYVVAPGREPQLSNRMRERLAIAIVSLIASQHLRGGPPYTLQRLINELHAPMYAVAAVLDALTNGGLLAATRDDPPAYLPARDFHAVLVKDLLEMVRSAGEDRFLNPAVLTAPPAVAQLYERIERALTHALGDMSIEALAVDTTTPPKLERARAQS